MLNSCEPLLNELKTKLGISREEWETLGKLKQTGSKADLTTIKGINHTTTRQTDSWVCQTDRDLSLLKDRIGQCSEIINIVKEQFVELLSELKNLDFENFTFAPVKQYERSSQKLKEDQIEKLKKEDISNVRSALMLIKDILRCSIICTSPEMT